MSCKEAIVSSSSRQSNSPQHVLWMCSLTYTQNSRNRHQKTTWLGLTFICMMSATAKSAKKFKRFRDFSRWTSCRNCLQKVLDVFSIKSLLSLSLMADISSVSISSDSDNMNYEHLFLSSSPHPNLHKWLPTFLLMPHVNGVFENPGHYIIDVIWLCNREWSFQDL